MRIIASFVFLSFYFTHSANSQELIYDINIAGKRVGSLLVNKIKKDSLTNYYSAISDVQYTLFRKTEMVYMYEALFQNDCLTKAYFIYKKNGEIEEESKLLWSKDGLYLSNIASFHKKQKTMLNKSMIQLYFQKPVHKDSIFSERFHDFVTIAEVKEENKFILYIPNGDKNIYYYNEEGICWKININTNILSFEIVLKDPSSDKE
ncbi:MAG: hypothetical protein ACJAT1_000739 [Marivirga sp.]|jgi:hypothetical protein